MMTAVTAAVAGVILNLAVWLALRVFASDLIAIAFTVIAFAGIVRWKWNMIAVILAGAAVGLTRQLISA
jgi:hypothetical protein